MPKNDVPLHCLHATGSASTSNNVGRGRCRSDDRREQKIREVTDAMVHSDGQMSKSDTTMLSQLIQCDFSGTRAHVTLVLSTSKKHIVPHHLKPAGRDKIEIPL